MNSHAWTQFIEIIKYMLMISVNCSAPIPTHNAEVVFVCLLCCYNKVKKGVRHIVE